MKTLVFALLVAFASSAIAKDTTKIQGNASKPYTLLAPGITIKRGDKWDVTVQAGKTTFKVQTGDLDDHGMKLPDGTIYTAVQSSQCTGCFDVMQGKKLVALISEPLGEIQLAGQKKKLKFDDKGTLVGAKTKVTYSPANTFKDVDVLMAVVVLLHDKI